MNSSKLENRYKKKQRAETNRKARSQAKQDKIERRFQTKVDRLATDYESVSQEVLLARQQELRSSVFHRFSSWGALGLFIAVPSAVVFGMLFIVFAATLCDLYEVANAQQIGTASFFFGGVVGAGFPFITTDLISKRNEIELSAISKVLQNR